MDSKQPDIVQTNLFITQCVSDVEIEPTTLGVIIRGANYFTTESFVSDETLFFVYMKIT